jgi:hypothetical protein
MRRLSILIVLLAPLDLLAHTPVRTRFEFHADVLPILERHCGACHRDGGAAPMSLLRWREARAWALAIKEEVLERRMPPWFAEDGLLPLRSARSLSAREIDILADWASGGAPEGKAAPAASAASGGAGGREVPQRPPDLVFPLAPPAMAAGERELAVLETIPLALEGERFLAAFTLVPADPLLLRGALLHRAPEGPAGFLGSWTAGQDPWAFPEGAAARLSPGERLSLRLIYRRSWADRPGAAGEGELRLWLAPAAPPEEVRALPLIEAARLPRSGRLLGILPGGSAFRLAGRGRHHGAPLDLLLDIFRADPAWPLGYLFLEPPRLEDLAELALEPPGAARQQGAGEGAILYSLPLED